MEFHSLEICKRYPGQYKMLNVNDNRFTNILIINLDGSIEIANPDDITNKTVLSEKDIWDIEVFEEENVVYSYVPMFDIVIKKSNESLPF